MIIGAPAIVYSQDTEADRAFFRDILEFKSVDAGQSWLIFALPPAEIACHPSEKNGSHEIYLMCDNIKSEVVVLAKKGVSCSEIHEERWGWLTGIQLPGDGRLRLYQPKHPTAINP